MHRSEGLALSLSPATAVNLRLPLQGALRATRANDSEILHIQLILFRQGVRPSSRLPPEHRRRPAIRRTSAMATATANGNDDDLRTRTQQPMLARQRAKQSGTAAEDGLQAKRPGFFPLGYKEGFSQWVANFSTHRPIIIADIVDSGQMYQLLLLNIRSCPSSHTFASRLRKPKPALSPPRKCPPRLQNRRRIPPKS